jgi:hypothetical protein
MLIRQNRSALNNFDPLTQPVGTTVMFIGNFPVGISLESTMIRE